MRTTENSRLVVNESSKYSSSSNKIVGTPEYRVYSWRWVMLFIIWILNFANGSLWVTFAPIAPQTSEFYDMSEEAVNMLSVCFMIAYIPLGFVSQWFLDEINFRWGVLIGAWLTAIGSWLRYISAIVFNHRGTVPLVLLFGGQALAACAQPFLLNAPPKLATMWFTPEGRATADMVGTIGNILGVGVAQVLPPILIGGYNFTVLNTTHTVKQEPDMGVMLLVFAILCSVACLISTFGTRNAPPTAPSASAAEKATPFFKGLKMMYNNKPYLVVLMTFGIGLGIFNTITTILAQVIAPYGYNADDAGTFGGILVGVGLVASGITAPLLDKTHRYKEFYVVAFLLASISFAWFALTLLYYPHVYIMMVLPLVLLGIAAFIILPTALELSVETTYPVSAATSAGFLWMMGQIIGIITLFVCDYLRNPEGFLNAVWFLLSLVAAGTGLSLFLIYPLRVTYKRLEKENISSKRAVPINTVTAQ